MIVIKCKGCGIDFEKTRGRLYCDECKPPKEKVDGPPTETRAERLAIGMGLADDLRTAASKVGLGDIPEAELTTLAEEARKYHTALTEGKTSAVAQQIHTAMALAALRMREQALSLTQGSVAHSVKALVQAQEALTGGTQRIYSQVVIQLPGGHIEGT